MPTLSPLPWRRLAVLGVLLLILPACSDDAVTPVANSITVTDPATGIILLEGTDTDITWTTTGNPGPVTIGLLKGGNAFSIISNIHEDGSPYTWTVDTEGVNGDDFSIAVIAAAVPDVSSESGLFTIETLKGSVAAD